MGGGGGYEPIYTKEELRVKICEYINTVYHSIGNWKTFNFMGSYLMEGERYLIGSID